MRRPIYHFVFLLVFGITGKASAESRLLPDYEKEARIMYHGMCDQGRINYTTYWKKGGYVLEVAVSETQGVFYMLKRYVGGNEGWYERYFIRTRDSKNLTELAHEEWDERVKQASITYFNKLHDLETTCSRFLVM